MYLLEKRERHHIFRNTWQPWFSKQFFDEKNSRNPRLEALQTFENIKREDGVRWRIIHNGRLLIEHR